MVDEMAVFLAVPQEEAQIVFLDPVPLALWFVEIQIALDSVAAWQRCELTFTFVNPREYFGLRLGPACVLGS